MDAEWFVKLGIALMALVALPFALGLVAFFYILSLLVRLGNAIINP